MRPGIMKQLNLKYPNQYIEYTKLDEQKDFTKKIIGGSPTKAMAVLSFLLFPPLKKNNTNLENNYMIVPKKETKSSL